MPQKTRNRNYPLGDARRREAARHKQIRDEVEQELPELAEWARAAAARHRERIAVGTVFTTDELPVLSAIDEYAAKHSPFRTGSRCSRSPLARLLGIEIAPK